MSVEVSVGYFASQRQGKKVVSHLADVLHRAASSIRAPFGPDSTEDVNLIRLRTRGRDQIGVFWYEINGRVVSGKYRAKWLTLWDSVVHRRSNGMVVVLLAEKDKRQSEEQAD